MAVGATRFGASSALLGGAGDDPWGRWLRDRLVAEGVDVTGFALLDGVDTPHAFVAVGPDGEPEFTFFGDGEACVASAAGRVQGALEKTAGVFVFGSDSLVGAVGRQATAEARRLALERGWSVLYDPNLRPGRWPRRRDDAGRGARAAGGLHGREDEPRRGPLPDRGSGPGVRRVGATLAGRAVGGRYGGRRGRRGGGGASKVPCGSLRAGLRRGTPPAPAMP